MRFDTINASNFLVWQLEYANVVTNVRDEGDILVVDLRGGEQVMILLVERGMNLSEVRYHLETNTQRGLYTLFIPWVDMLLPPDGSDYLLDDWMQVLSSLHGDKLYGFEVAGRTAYFFPVYLRGEGRRRKVRFGNVVDYAQIGGKTVETINPHLPGSWRIAGFEPRGQSYRRYTTQEALSRVSTLSDYYAILGISEQADLDTVKQAYRRLARQYHPDLNAADDAAARMIRINDAYQRIMQERDS